MCCVAELDDAYITQMEAVLALYEKPYNVAEPVVCLDEKPVALHADIRPPVRLSRATSPSVTTNISAAVQPTSSPS